MTFPIGCDPRDFPSAAEPDVMCPECRGAGCRACTWTGELTPEQRRDRDQSIRYWREYERNENHDRN